MERSYELSNLQIGSSNMIGVGMGTSDMFWKVTWKYIFPIGLKVSPLATES